MSGSHADAPNDTSAAYRGLAIGAVLVFAILLATVKVTNASFAGGEGHGKAAAETTTPAH
jgi:hypothetical protein